MKNKPDNTSFGLCFFYEYALHLSYVNASVTVSEIVFVSGTVNVFGALPLRASKKRNAHVVEKGVHDTKDRGNVIDHILSTRLVAGLLAIYPGQTGHHLKRLHKQGIPVVLLDDQGVPPEDMLWGGSKSTCGSLRCYAPFNPTGTSTYRPYSRTAEISGLA